MDNSVQNRGLEVLEGAENFSWDNNTASVEGVGLSGLLGYLLLWRKGKKRQLRYHTKKC